MYKIQYDKHNYVGSFGDVSTTIPLTFVRYDIIVQWFQNKPATTGVPPATWLYVAGYSGHNSLLVTNNLGIASYL